jgi:hypothetical protein
MKKNNKGLKPFQSVSLSDIDDRTQFNLEDLTLVAGQHCRATGGVANSNSRLAIQDDQALYCISDESKLVKVPHGSLSLCGNTTTSQIPDQTRIRQLMSQLMKAHNPDVHAFFSDHFITQNFYELKHKWNASTEGDSKNPFFGKDYADDTTIAQAKVVAGRLFGNDPIGEIKIDKTELLLIAKIINELQPELEVLKMEKIAMGDNKYIQLQESRQDDALAKSWDFRKAFDEPQKKKNPLQRLGQKLADTFLDPKSTD